MGERFRELTTFKNWDSCLAKNVKNYATLQRERTASIAFQNQSDKTLFVIHEKKLFAQAKGIKTHCNAFYVNKNRAVMPVISLSLSYVVSDMI